MAVPFVTKRQKRWNRLNELLIIIERQGINTLAKHELIEFSVIYRQTATDLAQAKTEKLNEEIIAFLNQLVSRAYHHIYSAETTTFRQLKNLYLYEFPQLVRKNHPLLLFSFGLLLLGWLIGFLGYLLGPQVITNLMPQNFATEIISKYQNNEWFNDPLINRPYISARIMYNNISVAVGAFAGGMLLGTYTCVVLLFNGFILGVLSAVFLAKGHFISFWAMILPHGVIELTAIILAAAGGILLARSILFPGEYSRSDALRIHGAQAAKLFTGTVMLLVIAGLIEGFLSTISHKVIPESIRLIFAGLTGIWLFWYLCSGLKEKPDSRLK